MINTTAKHPFKFYTTLHLSEITGIKACNISELLEGIKTAPGACIYYQSHRFLYQHQYTSPEPPNGFAFWVQNVLGDLELGELLASINTVNFEDINSFRDEIIKTIEHYITQNAAILKRFAEPGQEFHFIKAITFVVPTKHKATDLKEFKDIIKDIPIKSIYLHMFEAKLGLGRAANDFSLWLSEDLGQAKLAEELRKMDPYTYTLEELRNKIIALLSKEAVS